MKMASKKRKRRGIKRHPPASAKNAGIYKDLLPDAAGEGRPRAINMRKRLNAILYVTRGDIAWHLLPLDFPTWQAVCCYFRRWTKNDLVNRNVLIQAPSQALPP